MSKFDGKENDFIFELSKFYDKCQHIGLLSNVYLEDAFFILTSQVQTYFYAN